MFFCWLSPNQILCFVTLHVHFELLLLVMRQVPMLCENFRFGSCCEDMFTYVCCNYTGMRCC